MDTYELRPALRGYISASNCQETWLDLVMTKDKISPQACSPEGTGIDPGAVMPPRG